ncbi:carboxylate-amine ligase [Aggregatilinea lenta]|uniref:carboxylate-amine ligase n=1 Tax=Aggregatilinea lenta TaxID=913108 RepID=UPI000E5C2391|nr:carboxylate-amine ligase [Aggregatilinea lenta]
MFVAPLTIGIEEEYQIVDPQTRELTSYVQQMMNRGHVVLGKQLKPEFMQSQIEVGSHICSDIKDARAEIVRLRQSVCEVAADAGAAIIAAATHPFSHWQDQRISEGERYDDLATEMRDAARRLLIFGMHVHLGFGQSDEAMNLVVDILNQLRYFLPHILALTTSSPFWHGRDSGLKSYRSLVFENMPRSGIPPQFYSYTEYNDYVNVMGKVGSLGRRGGTRKETSNRIAIGDPTKIWWDARPHPDLGTLEVRICDMCTDVNDAISVAALIQALVAKLIKLRNQNQSWRTYRGMFIDENKWRAVRYGIQGKLIDFGIGEEVPLRALMDELIEIVDDVVDDLNSRDEVAHIRTIAERGTSADRQLAIYHSALKGGASEKEALFAVVDHLIMETNSGW